MSKRGLVTILIVILVLLLALNSTFIIATSNLSSNQESEKQNQVLIKSINDNEDDDNLDDNENEIPITGRELEKASAVALKYIGQGRVTDTEIGEEGYYEIEITLDNGDQVDVHLDRNFKIISAEWED